MFTRLAAVVLRAPRITLIAAFLFLLLAGGFGTSVLTQLPAGGYDPPDAESSRAERILTDRFGAGGFSLVFAVTAPDGVDSAPARDRAGAILAALHQSSQVKQVVSYWDEPAQQRSALAGRDGRTGLIAGLVAGTDKDAMQRAHDIATPLIGDRDGVTVTAGGQAVSLYELNHQSQVDAVKMDMIAIPLTFLVLVWVFGSVLAASVPLAISMFALAGSVAWLRILVSFTDVAVFAVNVAQALGLALAIDYTLFIISRFREEKGAGLTPEQALIRTLNTAGRTVAYSALTVGIAMSVMLVFPMYFMRSLAFGGLGAIAFCLIGALVVAPALIVVLGDRLDALDVRPPIRRLFGRSGAAAPEVQRTAWYRGAMFAMRRAVPVIVLVSGLLVILSLPLLGARFGYPDDRALPGSTQSRQTGDVLRAQFPVDSQGRTPIVFPDAAPPAAELTAYAQRLSLVDGVVAVQSPGATVAKGQVVSDRATDAAAHADAAYLTVQTTKDPFSQAGRDQLAELKAVTAPGETLFGGLTQRDLDAVHGISDRLPLALALMVLATAALLFMMTGSVVLPLKAIVMNVLSLTAAIGAMVWVFQDHHLGGLGTTAIGRTVVTMPILLGCMAFGLAMDYEVFVLSRIREEWLRSDRSDAASRQSVAVGLARSGRIVTAAATVMAIAFAAMMVSQVSFARGLGFGLTLAVLMDAFLVRILLVPAFMKVMGRANWWAPKPLARWHNRHQWREEGPAGPALGSIESSDPRQLSEEPRS
ncbi:RND superfamily putative drug exporter [Nocardia kruczakiae]|uniref:RND superfamily putative drug exporter n=1 Tax=Nocardia kruczakiae TaxID=261477 RepID=A0ABU1XBT2_9NOCA|nr:MMPL family transporter [Nocardia kruczakiae]MDR7168003.1 RND superfamily putative drug exporter [Nocardia kruczakiae]